MSSLPINIQFPILFLKERRQFVAYSPILDLSTSGHSLLESKRRFSEAVQLFFEEIVQQGTLETVLSDLGWQKIKHEWRPPEMVSSSVQQIPVSLSCA